MSDLHYDPTGRTSVKPILIGSDTNPIRNRHLYGSSNQNTSSLTNTTNALAQSLSGPDCSYSNFHPQYRQDILKHSYEPGTCYTKPDTDLHASSAIPIDEIYFGNTNALDQHLPTLSSRDSPYDYMLQAGEINKGLAHKSSIYTEWAPTTGMARQMVIDQNLPSSRLHNASFYNSPSSQQHPFSMNHEDVFQKNKFGALSKGHYYRDDFDLTLEPTNYSALHSAKLFRPKSAPLLTEEPSITRYLPYNNTQPSSAVGAMSHKNAFSQFQTNSEYLAASERNRNVSSHNYHSSVGQSSAAAVQNEAPELWSSRNEGMFHMNDRGGRANGSKQGGVGVGLGDFGGLMSGALDAGNGNVCGTDEIRQQSFSSESQAYYGNERMVNELTPEFVRWFYKYEQERKWLPFAGYDSIRIENIYREIFLGSTSYSANLRYPAASSNHESTDLSQFAQRFNQTSINNNGQFSNVGHMGLDGWRDCNSIDQKPWLHYQGQDDSDFRYGARDSMNSLLFQNGHSASYAMGRDLGGMKGGAAASHIVVVREGLYEVDLKKWTCSSTYWPGDTSIITRGTWFFDGAWEPLPVEQAEKLEEAHLTKFYGAEVSRSGPANKEQQPHAGHSEDNSPPIYRLSFSDFHVDWTSPSDVFWYNAAPSHKLMRSVGQKLGFSDWGQRICRGYYKPAVILDKDSEISHVVFVIHGIGQKMDTGRIVRNCSAFRDCVSSMKEKFFPGLNNAKQRAEFFPVEWRSAAKLDGDVVEAITPQKLVSLRQLLNSTAMDIMYYTSPLYRAEIQNALADELNRIYTTFVNRNPNFLRNGGKVSVLAHSLGAVITYDIITGYLCSSRVNDMSGLQHQLQYPPMMMPSQQGLLFKLEHFFCLGSPLSVFLALRWREPHDPTVRSQILPTHLCKRIYNVFYSSDPVAYRMEPLLNRQYMKIAPVVIHSYNTPVKPKYSEMPRERITVVSKTGTDNTTSPSIPVSNEDPVPSSNTPMLPSLKTPLPSIPSFPKAGFPSVLKMPQAGNKATGGTMDQQQANNNWGNWFSGNLKKLWNGSAGPAFDLVDKAGVGVDRFGNSQMEANMTNMMTHNVPTNEMEQAIHSAGAENNYSSVPDEDLLNIHNDLDYRLDYVLRESQFSGSGYIAALTSHTAYWSSQDTAYFVMTHLYGDLIEHSQNIGPPPPLQ